MKVFAMQPIQEKNAASGNLLLLTVLLNAVVMKQGYLFNANWYLLLLLTIPALLASILYHKRKRR